jgi:hypothetical protein
MIAQSDVVVTRPAAARLIDVNLHALPADEAARLLDAAPFDRFLDYAFTVLLNRAADPVGQRHYRALADGGKSRRAIVRDLLRSAEFTHRYGPRQRAAQPLDDFINQVYQDVLGRWPDADGLATYRRIGARYGGRGRVIANILQSAEGQRRGGGRLGRIASLQAFARYERLLRLPVLGAWLRRRDAARVRLERIELGQQALATQLARLQLQAGTASHAGEAALPPLDPAALADPAAVDAWAYRAALRRARRSAMLGD